MPMLSRVRDPQFRILGPLEVEGPAGMVRIPPGRQQVILASLLVEANQVVSTEHLVDALWEDQPPDTARTQVQICVSRLRRNLSDGGVQVPIITRLPGYILRMDPTLLDVHTVTSQGATARVLAKEGRTAEAAALLRSAVALWRGPCLSGISNRALRTQALRQDEERLAYLSRMPPPPRTRAPMPVCPLWNKATRLCSCSTS
jgi:DNA-binding SARP family transcriptional activator